MLPVQSCYIWKEGFLTLCSAPSSSLVFLLIFLSTVSFRQTSLANQLRIVTCITGDILVLNPPLWWRFRIITVILIHMESKNTVAAKYIPVNKIDLLSYCYFYYSMYSLLVWKTSWGHPRKKKMKPCVFTKPHNIIFYVYLQIVQFEMISSCVQLLFNTFTKTHQDGL